MLSEWGKMGIFLITVDISAGRVHKCYLAPVALALNARSAFYAIIYTFIVRRSRASGREGQAKRMQRSVYLHEIALAERTFDVVKVIF
jgi:hypothetical protein